MSSSPSVSLEFFPPRSNEMTLRLQGTLARLVPYGVAYCTVSYGAGGSTRKGTAEWVRRIRQDYAVDCAPHLTHVSHGRDEVRSIVGEYLAVGVRRIVAIRGDLPPDGVSESTRARGYPSTVEMVADLRAIGVREITVGAHPEHGGGDSSALRCHVDFLKRKLDAGADVAITQFFLDNSRFYRLRDACAVVGIDQCLVPGIMPLHNVRQVFSFARKTHVNVPGPLLARLESVGNDSRTVQAIARGFSLNQVCDLASQGVERFHVYTMNRAPLAEAICEALGLTAAVSAA